MTRICTVRGNPFLAGAFVFRVSSAAFVREGGREGGRDVPMQSVF